MKVIGAGFARTGTLSLKAALETLGIAPCLHPLEDEPDAGSVSVGTSDDPRRLRVRLAPWRATLGWVGARHYRELAEAFPEAIVLLGVRDPEAWYRSYASCLKRTRALALRGGDGLGVAETVACDALMLCDGRMGRDLLDGLLVEQERALVRFGRHNEEVASLVPLQRLFGYVAHGWGPLCERLAVAEPKQAFATPQ